MQTCVCVHCAVQAKQSNGDMVHMFIAKLQFEFKTKKVVIISSHTVEAPLNREYSDIKIESSHQHQNMASNRNMMLVPNAHCTTMHAGYLLHFGMYFDHEISLFCGHFLMCCFSILLLHICFLSRPSDGASIKFMVKLWSILIIQLRLFVHFIALGQSDGFENIFHLTNRR